MYHRLIIITAILLLLPCMLFSQNTTTQEKPGTEKPVIKEPEIREPGILSFVPGEKKGPDEKKWFFDLTGMYNRKKGNTDTLNENISTELIYDNNVTAFELGFSGFYGESSGIRNEKKGRGVIKLDHYIFPRIELFIFSQSEYNKPALLTYRNNSGGGAKFVFFKNYFWKVDLSGAPVYQYEDYEDYEDRNQTHELRWSIRFRIKMTPLEWLKLNVTAFYIPEWNNYENYRTDFISSMTVYVAKHVSIKAGYIHGYNTDALPGTKKTDQTIYTQAGIHL